MTRNRKHPVRGIFLALLAAAENWGRRQINESAFMMWFWRCLVHLKTLELSNKLSVKEQTHTSRYKATLLKLFTRPSCTSQLHAVFPIYTCSRGRWKHIWLDPKCNCWGESFLERRSHGQSWGIFSHWLWHTSVTLTLNERSHSITSTAGRERGEGGGVEGEEEEEGDEDQTGLSADGKWWGLLRRAGARQC